MREVNKSFDDLTEEEKINYYRKMEKLKKPKRKYRLNVYEQQKIFNNLIIRVEEM